MEPGKQQGGGLTIAPLAFTQVGHLYTQLPSDQLFCKVAPDGQQVMSGQTAGDGGHGTGGIGGVGGKTIGAEGLTVTLGRLNLDEGLETVPLVGDGRGARVGRLGVGGRVITPEKVGLGVTGDQVGRRVGGAVGLRVGWGVGGFV